MEENRVPKKRNYEKYLEGEIWTPEQQTSSPYHVPAEDYTAEYLSADYGNEKETNPVPAQIQPVYSGLEEPVSMGDWALCFFLSFIPCVGFIMMFVWAFGKDVKKSKSNFFKVSLIYAGIMLVIYLFVFLFAIATTF